MNSKVMNKVLSFLLVAAVAFTTIFTPVNAATVNSRDKKLKGKIKEMHVYDGLTEIANKDTIQMAVGATKTLTIEFVDKSEKKAATHQVVAKSNNKKAVAATADYDKDLNESVVTLAVDATAKAGDKATVTIKSKAKKVKTVKFNVEVIEMVPVTGVTLDNTAPKVGDTINAKYAPETATDPKFAWFVGDSATQVETPILDATTASFSVTEAYVGKFIKVTVTGVDGSAFSATTTAAVQAAATDKIGILSAKQTKAAEIEVKFNKPITTSGWDIEVNRGTTAQTISTVLDDSATTATITLGTALSTAEYTVKITNKTDATETATATVAGEQATLKSIDFIGEQLILMDSTLKKAAVSIKGLNQFEEQVALSGSLTVYTTKGTAKYDQANSKIEITCTDNTTFFNTGEQVTVTAVYNQGTNILQVAKPLTVSNVATLTTFELGDISTTRATLKDKPINLTNLKTDTYYFPVKTAQDQYGNDLSATDLDDMMVKANETGVAAGNLYITPNSIGGSYAYVTGFTKLSDNTIAMNVSEGDLGSPGKAIFTITGVSGYQGTQELDIVDDPYIAELSVTPPTLYAGSEAEITIDAKDQDGNTVNLYDYIGTTEGGTGVTTTPIKTYKFDKKNHLTKGSATLTFTNGAIKVNTNTSKKTVTFTYVAPSTAGTEAVVVQSATPVTTNLQWTVNDAVAPAGIKGLKSTIETTVLTGTNRIDLSNVKTNGNLTFLDTSGAEMDYTKFTTASQATYPLLATSGSADLTNPTVAQTTAAYIYTVETSNNSIVRIDSGDGELDAVAPGTATITVTLYGKGATSTALAPSKLATYTFKVNVTSGSYVDYKATIAKGEELLYVDKDSSDTTGFTVVGVDSNGFEKSVAATVYDVTVDDGFTVNSDKKIVGANDTKKAAGTAVATIWVGGKAYATVDVPYDVADPAPQKTNVTKEDTAGNKSTPAGTDFVNIQEGTLTDGVLVLKDSSNAKYTMSVKDQYNQNMSSTVWALGGKNLTATIALTPGDTQAVTCTNVKVAGSWTITNTASAGNITVLNTAYVEVASADALQTALTKAALDATTANEIVLTASVSVSEDMTVAEKDILVIPAGVKLTMSGTLTNNGTIKGASATDCGTLYVTGAGGTYAGTGGYVYLTQNSLVFGDGSKIDPATTGTLAGHIVIESGATGVDFQSAVITLGDTEFDIQPGATLNNADKVNVAAGATAEVNLLTTGETFQVNNSGSQTVTGDITITATNVTGTDVVVDQTADALASALQAFASAAPSSLHASIELSDGDGGVVYMVGGQTTATPDVTAKFQSFCIVDSSSTKAATLTALETALANYGGSIVVHDGNGDAIGTMQAVQGGSGSTTWNSVQFIIDEGIQIHKYASSSVPGDEKIDNNVSTSAKLVWSVTFRGQEYKLYASGDTESAVSINSGSVKDYLVLAWT